VGVLEEMNTLVVGVLEDLEHLLEHLVQTLPLKQNFRLAQAAFIQLLSAQVELPQPLL